MTNLADVLRQFGSRYLDQHTLSVTQAKAWRAIVACRTSALGGQCLICDSCGHSHWQYHSCRNRHCPQCGSRAKDAWLQGRLAEVLPVPYAHLVFTLPHSLNTLYGVHSRWVIDTLFGSVAQTLSEFAANPKWMDGKNGSPAFSLVLHTWTQDLQRHIHIHAVMACGVLNQQGQWSPPTRKPDFLFPVHALSRVFRGKFMAALAIAHRDGGIEQDPQGTNSAWRERQRALYRHDWVVYAKTPLGGAAHVLEYLSRYTHRTAISNERIRSLDAEQVVFTVRANDEGGKRMRRLEGTEFVRRFLLHVLPKGIKRLRHYGVLASACKKIKLGAARQALQMPALNPRAVESARDFMIRVAKVDMMVCPYCKTGRLRVSEVLTGNGRLSLSACGHAQAGAPGGVTLQQSRGPP